MAAKPTESRIVTCESMTTGHPDKLCDQISDALLDAYLVRDPYTRCGIEAAASGNEVWVFGQVASRDPLQYNEIVKIVRGRDTASVVDLRGTHHVEGLLCDFDEPRGSSVARDSVDPVARHFGC